MAKVLGFYLVFTPLSTYLGHLAELAGAKDFLILFVTMLANFILEYLFCKFVVFRENESAVTNTKAEETVNFDDTVTPKN